MSGVETIIRMAAKGDGVTQSGRHVVHAVSGDQVRGDEIVHRGPHHADPACRHFGRCGGCQLQHADDKVLRTFIRDRVVNAARKQHIEPAEVLDVHLSPPRSRRRATVHALRMAKRVVVGFREGGSHRVVDMAQCEVLDPRLFELVRPVRAFLAKHGGAGAIDVSMALCDQGVDVGMTNVALDGLAATEDASDFAASHKLARLTLDLGYGAEPVWEPEPVTVTFSDVRVPLPPDAFLQATRDAQDIMVGDAMDWIGEARSCADLFAGLGPFAFALAKVPKRRVLAVEAQRVAHLACRSVAGRAKGMMQTFHRDLFRAPLTSEELSQFDTVLLDPPRAGARAQIEQISASNVERVAYISCNPASWARDAATLAGAGYTLARVRPIGQFRWSTHVELTSLFVKN